MPMGIKVADDKRKHAIKLRNEEKLSIAVIAERLGVHKGTVHNWCKQEKKEKTNG